jgi:hypothetical protein
VTFPEIVLAERCHFEYAFEVKYCCKNVACYYLDDVESRWVIEEGYCLDDGVEKDAREDEIVELTALDNLLGHLSYFPLLLIDSYFEPPIYKRSLHFDPVSLLTRHERVVEELVPGSVESLDHDTAVEPPNEDVPDNHKWHKEEDHLLLIVADWLHSDSPCVHTSKEDIQPALCTQHLKQRQHSVKDIVEI